MRYQHVCIEALGCTLPPCVVTSAELEARLAPVYERLGLPAGRLELMSGIRERRFFEPGTRPDRSAPAPPSEHSRRRASHDGTSAH